jgi:hypothetical protein
VAHWTGAPGIRRRSRQGASRESARRGRSVLPPLVGAFGVPRCECLRHLPSARPYPGRRLPVDTVSLTAVLAPVVLVGAAVVAVAFSTLLSAPPEDRFGQPTSLPESPPPEPPTRSEATETTPAEGRSYVRTSRVQPTCWRTRLLEAAVHDGAMVAPPAALLAGVFRQKRLYVLTSSGVDLLLLAPPTCQARPTRCAWRRS